MTAATELLSKLHICEEAVYFVDPDLLNDDNIERIDIALDTFAVLYGLNKIDRGSVDAELSDVASERRIPGGCRICIIDNNTAAQRLVETYDSERLRQSLPS